MTVYLVDYENVNVDGMNGVSNLDADSRVVIFYTDHADKLTFGLHRRLNESAAEISFFRVKSGGKNALDFQLATYLGHLVAADKEQEYCIVSKDSGFGYVTSFWNEKGIIISTAQSIADFLKRKNPAACTGADADADSETQKPKRASVRTAPSKKQQTQSAMPAELKELITDAGERTVVNTVINKYKTKQGINNALVKNYGSARAGELYKLIKPFISDKKGR